MDQYLSRTDGDGVGASLDRNGLRPCRYYITKDNRLILASDAGVLGVTDEDVVEKGRVSPGKMLWVDFARNRVQRDSKLKESMAKGEAAR